MAKRIRKATVKRKTTETDIVAGVNVDGSGKGKIRTGIGLVDHMLHLFAFHGLFDLEIVAKGDLEVDKHHTNEDIGIVLGQIFKKALAEKKGISRFGHASVPMEEVLARVSLDINGRGFLKVRPEVAELQAVTSEEGYQFQYVVHLFESFASHLGMNLSIEIERGLCTDLHTILESVFKALGLALDQATRIDPRRKGVPSTKGVID